MIALKFNIACTNNLILCTKSFVFVMKGNNSMRRLFALALLLCLWLGFAPPASAASDVAGLTPCNESPAFQQRAANARTEAARARFQKYANSNLVCGPEGLPHLVVDGRLNHANEFIIPSLMFLYIAGWIGWVGRSYIRSVRQEKDPEMHEIIIDVPRAIGIMLSGFLWPLAAVKELLSGELTAKEEEIPISPR
jgi:photosystem I subunit III